MFVTLDDTRKKGQNVFSSWKQLFFEMFVSIDHLGPKEVILSILNFLSEYFLYSYNMFHEFFMFDKTREIKSTSILRWKGCFSNNLLGPKKRLL